MNNTTLGRVATTSEQSKYEMVPTTNIQREQLLAQFPEHISLAYTCAKPDTLSPTYDLQVNIPKGRRFFLWLHADTEQQTNWYLLEPGKYGEIKTVYSSPTPNNQYPTGLLGSIVSGYLVDIPVADTMSVPIFIVDDIYQYNQRLLVHTVGDDQPCSTRHCSTKIRLTDSVKAEYLYQYMSTIQSNPVGDGSCSARNGVPFDTTHPLPFGFYGIYMASMAPEQTSASLSNCSYPIKHTLYRSTTEILPHYYGADINCPVSLVSEVSDNVRRIFHAFYPSSKPRYMHFAKPAYRNNRSVFLVQACEMSDIYKLYCRAGNLGSQASPPLLFSDNSQLNIRFNSRGTPFLTEHDCRRFAVDQFNSRGTPHRAESFNYELSENKRGGDAWEPGFPASDVKHYQQMSFVFYQYALVPDYRTSILLNTLFRNVPANQNLDVIEDSDDESDDPCLDSRQIGKGQRTSSGQLIPENTDLERTLLMECEFDWLRKQWIPHTLVTNVNSNQTLGRNNATGESDHLIPFVHEL
jgi:hypothetical protein